MRSRRSDRGRWLALGPWFLLALAVADWLALRRGIDLNPPWALALLVGVVIAAFTLRLLVLGRHVVGARDGLLRSITEAILLAGILLALGAGSANWLLSLQGYVILNEREAVRLDGEAQLQSFEAGPLAQLEEMRFFLALNELDLVPEGPSRFLPVSWLDVWREGEEKARLEVSPRSAGVHGVLRFHQGVFGFAPRIVVLGESGTLFDRVVPFTTERSGPSGISFSGSFTVKEHGLEFDGQVDLASLDEGMRGHASLVLEVRQNGEPLGRGSLRPGEFADLDGGLRVGFAGLEQWSEIVVSRRNYGRWVLAGGVIALAGAVLLPVAWWRSR